MKNDYLEKIEYVINDMMIGANIPGLSITIFNNGQEFYTNSFGIRDFEKILPMTNDTLLKMISVSKTFCVLAIMQLVEKKKISLNDNISKYLDFMVEMPDHPIKIHHLLSNSSGIADLNFGAIISAGLKKKDQRFLPIADWTSFFQYLNHAKSQIICPPEQKFLYNDTMFSVLAALIEKVTGDKYADYIKKNILSPLQMKRSTYHLDNVHKDGNFAKGYIHNQENKSLQHFETLDYEIEYANRGLFSSINEMKAYLECLLNNGIYDGKKIISKESIRKIWTKHIDLEENSIYSPNNASFGYGWFIEDNFFNNKLVHIEGNGLNFSNYTALIPELKIGISIAINSNMGAIAQNLSRIILAIILDKEIYDAIPELMITQKLEILEGNYGSYGDVVTGHLTVKNGFLKFTINDPSFLKPVDFICIPSNLEKLEFYSPLGWPKLNIKIKFFIDPSNLQVKVNIDKYLLHKH
ncbi:MAG: beta-lactamase family protein [Candidatus Lokiarchaeota archaeon]|nr:beta-lactamase family protein [Candidatus Harpocratesius repetitus]